MIGQMVFVDASKSGDLEEVIAPNIQKAIQQKNDLDHVMVFVRNLGIINEVMCVTEYDAQKTLVKDIEFCDGITRDRLKPQ